MLTARRFLSMRSTSLNTLAGRKVGVCVSGGLDSKTVCTRLVAEGVDVTAFCADLGQPDETDISDVQKRMAACGVDTVIVDLKPQMARGCFDIIRCLGRYDGGYWNTTSIGRQVTCAGLLPEMISRGIDVFAHGATGRRNDQMRFERYANVLAPSMAVYAPWRDPLLLAEFPGRREMAAYLQAVGIPAFSNPKKRGYSTDANLAGLSAEGDDLEALSTPMLVVEPELSCWPEKAPETMEEVELRFFEGDCIAINGISLSPLEAMITANRIGGKHALGISHAVENQLLGTKTRGVYEAPGMEMLGRALELLFQVVLDRRATSLHAHLSRVVSDQIYDGRWFDPATRAALRAVEELAKPATGTVRVGLYKGNVLFLGLHGANASLYSEADASLEGSDGLDPVSAQGFAEVQSAEARMLARAGQIGPSNFAERSP